MRPPKSGLPVPPRTVALSPDTAIESWAPTKAVNIDTQVLEWIASQMRGKRRINHRLAALVATLIGVAALPLAQLPAMLDHGDDVVSSGDDLILGRRGIPAVFVL